MSDFLPVDAYLPHRAPMLLLDRVIQVTDDSVICEVSINATGVLAPFLTPQGDLPAWYGVEIMAQTVGVWSGFHARQRGDSEIRPGMLLGGRGYRASSAFFAANSTLRVEMRLLMRDDRLGSFEGEIRCDDAIIASGRLNTYQPNEHELIQLQQGIQP
ncbi:MULTISPECIES: hotdog family protein [unclassified Enterobacter]|jgi:predicted hotdog family 3-hydroxylacyl-ACP dehydratase|uniref:ApeP family dehydratase n=1 Tax=unclassified Enterobacter TaxID=2608935 RepID=UPI0015C76B93|nr:MULTISPECIES: hotdog family protein [unclassified Enterobacter]MBB3305005.1 putative hotdog family 3-hydroxylacyl-ACP dehydratase [Enterobacter sp. Sphag1F]NYI13821.1 putative hotdog family 3-hydroxylacyl-ACP dehydratase [Enterobacter sp. Sphag71]